MHAAEREIMGEAGQRGRGKADGLDRRHEERDIADARAGTQPRDAMARPLAERKNARRKADVLDLEARLDRAVAEDDVEELQEVAADIVFGIGDRREKARSTVRGLLQRFQPAEDLVLHIALRHHVARDLDRLLQRDVERPGFGLRRIGRADEVADGEARRHQSASAFWAECT